MPRRTCPFLPAMADDGHETSVSSRCPLGRPDDRRPPPPAALWLPAPDDRGSVPDRRQRAAVVARRSPRIWASRATRWSTPTSSSPPRATSPAGPAPVRRSSICPTARAVPIPADRREAKADVGARRDDARAAPPSRHRSDTSPFIPACPTPRAFRSATWSRLLARAGEDRAATTSSAPIRVTGYPALQEAIARLRQGGARRPLRAGADRRHHRGAGGPRPAGAPAPRPRRARLGRGAGLLRRPGGLRRGRRAAAAAPRRRRGLGARPASGDSPARDLRDAGLSASARRHHAHGAAPSPPRCGRSGWTPGSSRTISTASTVSRAGRCRRCRASTGPIGSIYLGTFAKLLFPALRLGFMVLPEPLLESIGLALRITGQFAPLLLQAALADFIERGYMSTHLRRMRRIYAARRDVFLQARRGPPRRLADASTDRCRHPDRRRVAGWASTIAPSPRRPRRRGINVSPLSIHYRHAEPQSGLVMGYAATDEAAMPHGFRLLAGGASRGEPGLSGPAPFERSSSESDARGMPTTNAVSVGRHASRPGRRSLLPPPVRRPAGTTRIDLTLAYRKADDCIIDLGLPRSRAATLSVGRQASAAGAAGRARPSSSPPTTPRPATSTARSPPAAGRSSSASTSSRPPAPRSRSSARSTPPPRDRATARPQTPGAPRRRLVPGRSALPHLPLRRPRRARVAARRRRQAGLDFLAVTDHNTTTQRRYFHPASSPDLVFVRATEITTARAMPMSMASTASSISASPGRTIPTSSRTLSTRGAACSRSTTTSPASPGTTSCRASTAWRSGSRPG